MIDTQTLRAVAGYPGTSKETLIMFLLKAADEIDRLKHDGWISVKERLPRSGDTVLVYYRRGESRGVYILRYVGRWVMADWHTKVTHWQPLPEPPKE